jgi:hypothetical protein
VTVVAAGEVAGRVALGGAVAPCTDWTAPERLLRGAGATGGGPDPDEEAAPPAAGATVVTVVLVVDVEVVEVVVVVVGAGSPELSSWIDDAAVDRRSSGSGA